MLEVFFRSQYQILLFQYVNELLDILFELWCFLEW
jgi:hypothetical protein